MMERHTVVLRGTLTRQHVNHREYRYPRGASKTKHPLRYPTSHALIASTLITPPVDVKRTHVFEVSSKTQAHENSKQSDQTMAQPEVAPNVTTGITKVMLIRKVVGPLVVHPLKSKGCTTHINSCAPPSDVGIKHETRLCTCRAHRADMTYAHISP